MNKDKSILIVDDENITAWDIRTTLEDLNLSRIFIANSVIDALNIASQYKPELVIMDYELRDSVNGLELAKKINNIIKAKFIYVTGQADRATVRKILRGNQNSLIIKPFVEDELLAKVSLALGLNKTKTWEN